MCNSGFIQTCLSKGLAYLPYVVRENIYCNTMRVCQWVTSTDGCPFCVKSSSLENTIIQSVTSGSFSKSRESLRVFVLFFCLLVFIYFYSLLLSHTCISQLKQSTVFILFCMQLFCMQLTTCKSKLTLLCNPYIYQNLIKPTFS